MSRTVLCKDVPPSYRGLPACEASFTRVAFPGEPVPTQSIEEIRGPVAARDADILCLGQKAAQAWRKLEEVMASRGERHVPEVFDLPTPSRKRISIRVRRVEPAAFNYVADDALVDD